MSRVCLQWKIQNVYLRDNHICLIFLQLHQMLYAIKQATNKLDYNDVKNLARILSCCKCIQGLQWKIQNVYLWEIITFLTTPPICYMWINKQLINLVYNDMKNLMYSLICFNGVQSVFWNIDRKDLSVWDSHIDSFFTTTRKSFLRINKQLIMMIWRT